MLTYKKAGVDTNLADKLVEHIQKNAPAIGGFAGLFPLDLNGGSDWCLVACTARTFRADVAGRRNAPAIEKSFRGRGDVQERLLAK